MDAGAAYLGWMPQRTTPFQMVMHLVRQHFAAADVGRLMGADTHMHPEREQLKGFSCAIPVEPAGYFLQCLETGELHRICMLFVAGDFAWSQEELPLANFDLAGRRYGATKDGTFLGRPTVWVGTDHPESKTTKLSWRTTDQKPLLVSLASDMGSGEDLVDAGVSGWMSYVDSDN
jgi:hypothetical protein